MELTPAQVDLWFHYEEITMHFNQLIIQYRLQLMGGVGAIGAVASYLIASKTEEANRPGLRFVVSLTLLVLVSAAAYLDIYYYNQLLEGAVDALLEFEKNNPRIYMSTRIHDAVKGDWPWPVIHIWYSAIIVPLVVFVLWSINDYLQSKNKSG